MFGKGGSFLDRRMAYVHRKLCLMRPHTEQTEARSQWDCFVKPAHLCVAAAWKQYDTLTYCLWLPGITQRQHQLDQQLF